MNERTVLLELLLSGFFAVACFRASAPAQDDRVELAKLFRLRTRVERLRRSRWQWFSMVALTLILRLQQELPLILELTVLVQFALFVALPSEATLDRAERRAYESALGIR